MSAERAVYRRMRPKGRGSVLLRNGHWHAFAPQNMVGGKFEIASGFAFRHQAERALDLWLLDRMIERGGRRG